MIQGCAASKDVADCCPDAHTTSYASSEAPNHPSSLAEKASLSCLLKPRDSPFRGGHLCSTSHSGCLRFFWARLHVFTRLPARPARLSGERLPRQHPKPARPLERPRHRLQSEACFCFGSEMKILQVSVLHCGCATAAFGQSR